MDSFAGFYEFVADSPCLMVDFGNMWWFVVVDRGYYTDQKKKIIKGLVRGNNLGRD